MSEPYAGKDDSMVVAVRWELRRIANATVDAANHVRARSLQSPRSPTSAPLSEPRLPAPASGDPPRPDVPRTTLPGRVWRSLLNRVASVRGRIERLMDTAGPDERTVWHLAPRRRSRSHHSAHRR